MLPSARRALIVSLLASAMATDSLCQSTLVQERPTAEQKRCAAAQRRLARHQHGLAEVDERLGRAHEARTGCSSARACERLDRRIKSEEARRAHIARQLEQFEVESKRICASAR